MNQLLKNCISLDGTKSVLSDFHSPVAVSAMDSDQMGISQLYLKGLHLHSCVPFLRPALRLWVDVGMGWETVGVSERTAWPWGWSEVGACEGAEIRQEVCFLDGGSLRVSWSLQSERQVRLAVAGAFGGDVHVAAHPATGSGRRWTLTHQGHNLLVARPFEFAWNLELRTTESRIPGGPPDLPMQPPASSSPFVVEVPVNDGRAAVELAWSFDGTSPTFGLCENPIAAAEERWSKWIDAVLPEKPLAHVWTRKLTQALHDIVSGTLKAPGYGNYSEKMAALATPIDWPSTNFFWDSMIALPTLGMIDPVWAAEVIECYLQFMGPGSLPPLYTNAFPVEPLNQKNLDSQAPIASWALCKLWKCSGRETPLARLYPRLKLLHERWFEVADHDRDGFPEWRFTGCSADDSPIYDRYKPYGKENEHITCFHLPPHQSVNLSSYLLMDMRCLGMMAESLGLESEAHIWKTRVNEFSRLMIEHLWHPEDKIFFDRDTRTGEPARVKTFFSLLPLWAGVELPADEARAAIELHLLNPDEFWGDVPFPSTAYDEPTYDPMGYWRGRTWPHVYFWNSEILAKYGYEAEARHAKDRFLAMISQSREIPENFPARWDRTSQAGMPHYTFGTGTLVHFLLDWHAKPL